MNIQRIRRQRLSDDWPTCDYCDKEFTAGYTFMGDVYGPRGGSLSVCDKCLDKTRKSSIGFWDDSCLDTTRKMLEEQ